MTFLLGFHGSDLKWVLCGGDECLLNVTSVDLGCDRLNVELPAASVSVSALHGRDPTNYVVSSCHNLNMIYRSGYLSEEARASLYLT